MTKVQLERPLARPLEESDFQSIRRAHSVYGLHSVRVKPALDGIAVEFDASRLTEKDVEAALVSCGVPIARG